MVGCFVVHPQRHRPSVSAAPAGVGPREQVDEASGVSSGLAKVGSQQYEVTVKVPHKPEVIRIFVRPKTAELVYELAGCGVTDLSTPLLDLPREFWRGRRDLADRVLRVPGFACGDFDGRPVAPCLVGGRHARPETAVDCPVPTTVIEEPQPRKFCRHARPTTDCYACAFRSPHDVDAGVRHVREDRGARPGQPTAHVHAVQPGTLGRAVLAGRPRDATTDAAPRMKRPTPTQ